MTDKSPQLPEWTWRDSVAAVLTIPLTYFIAPAANRVLHVDPNWIIVSWICTAVITFMVMSLLVGQKKAWFVQMQMQNDAKREEDSSKTPDE